MPRIEELAYTEGLYPGSKSPGAAHRQAAKVPNRTKRGARARMNSLTSTYLPPSVKTSLAAKGKS
ncbi:hypothetical protein GCM10023213_44000 [Prosthecobacter algae]|uniref:Uncharacterized protein n=1 Tax=Prosthecobacter algae TaxID=1144682 RepID=A0ABP9PKJ3_9BACT